MTDRTIGKRLIDLVDEIPGMSMTGDPEILISDVAFDSRVVAPGDLFVALRGGYTDGHLFADRAVAQGAAAILAEEPVRAHIPQVLVPDSRAALATVADRFFDHPSGQLGLIGITGTDGKTSTSMLVEAMLAAAGAQTGLIGTVSVKIGDRVVDHETRQTTPESLDIQRILRRMVEAGVTWGVLEATSHGLAMHRLDHLAFDIAAVTNITHEHLDFHGSRAAYWAAKARLFANLRPDRGIAVINADDAGAMSVVPACGDRRVIRYGLEREDVELSAHDISLQRSGARYRLCGPFGERQIETPLLGRFNIANALCAAGVALAAGVDPDRIAAVLAAPPVISGRMAVIDAGQPFGVVVDYAHTPASLEKVLALLRSFPGQRRLIVVSGSAGERDREKRAIQGEVCTRMADISIFTNEDPRFESAEDIIGQIASGARAAGGVEGESFLMITDRRAAIFRAISLAEPGDTVLLAGKGHERSIIWNGVKHPWNEAEIAREALAARGFCGNPPA